jgi:outer membrane protein insertion porin family
LFWGDVAVSPAAAAHKHYCLRSIHSRVVVCLGALLFALVPAAARPQAALPPAVPGAVAGQAPVPAQAPQIVDSIVFDGARKYPQQTLQTRILTRQGDTYSESGILADYMALWNTQYFDDITLEVQESTTKPNAVIIIFHLVERPTISFIDYRGTKSVTKSDILDRFKERKVGLTVESQLDPTKVRRGEVVLQELLAEHGRQFAIVKGGVESIPATNRVRLIFNVDEGPKVKVGDIQFTGNTVFSRRKIIRSMRMSRPYSIPMWLFDVPVMSKTFDRSKLDQDLEIGIRGLYQNAGYFRCCGSDEPKLESVELNRFGLPLPLPLIGRKRGRATDITIPIDEGEQYRMGRLVIRSADPEKGLSVQREALESIFPLKQGDIFDVSKIRTGIETYTKLYGERGFIDFTATPSPDINDATRTVDLTFDFDEQKQFFVRRIDFVGNLTTRDRVIRRELLVGEGDIFNNRAWELSLLRLNQLDYFDEVKPTNAELKRNVQQSSVDILLTVKEKGRQSISLTGGVSGLSGSFIGLSYQTNNFLGLGETLTFSTSFGSFEKSAVFGFTEPYLFDRPIATGFTITSSRYSFDQSRQASLLLGQRVEIDPSIVQNYNQNTTGGTVFASYPLRRFSFSRVGITYGYSVTSIKAFSSASTLLFETLQFQSLAGPSAFGGIHSSKIIPTFNYNTVNNPVNPTQGKSLYLGVTVEGLGGNVRTISPVMTGTYFRPHYHGRNVIALHFLSAFATGYGGRVLPPYNRWFLGGEQDLRGFDVHSVAPVAYVPVVTSASFNYLDPSRLDISGNPTIQTVNIPTLAYQITFPGGDTQGVLNAEYRIPIAGPVTLAAFTDIGTVGVFKRDQLQLNQDNFSSLSAQFPGTSLSNRLPLAAGTNFHLRSSAGVELVVNLPVLNAPFRLYWSYNFRRLAQQIVAPASVFNQADLERERLRLPSDAFESQIQPQINNLLVNSQRINYFEPLRTFRFTVSRTF